jgi:sugar lactone lactonase YvrE
MGAGVCLVAACTAGDAGDPYGRSNLLVHNGEKGAWRDDSRWTLRELRKIGTADSGGPDVFGRVVDIELDVLGRVWIADAQSHALHVFDDSGKHVRSIGSKGAGPGEFQQLAGMAWSPEGQLWVQDPGNNRYTVFDTAGRMVTTHRREAGVAMIPWPGTFDRAGRLYDVAPIVAQDGSIETGIVRLTRDLATADTFRLPRFDGEFFELVSGTERNRSINRVAVPFFGEQVWAVDGEGAVWTSQTNRYRLVRQNFAGDTSRIVEREHKPVRVTATDVDAALEEYSWFTTQGGRIDQSRIPRTKPALNNFFFSPDGFTWVFPYTPADEMHRIDVFDPTGRYLGTLDASAHLHPVPRPTVRGETLAALTESADGAPQVVIYRIEKRSGGASIARSD